MGWGWGFKPYVSVAKRRDKAKRKIEQMQKQGIHVEGIEINGRKIANTFWGEAWCKHLESFSDYDNRLPRGRSYVRHGAVCHLEIAAGKVKALVFGSYLYEVTITIKGLKPEKWHRVKKLCTGKIGSLLELLQGRLSSSVMEVVTDWEEGLFPLPSEIKLDCSCPDYADMCKHVAAVLYGVGARLDEKPELLFLLRGVNHNELIDANSVLAASPSDTNQSSKYLAESELEDLFGIELVATESSHEVSGSGRYDASAKHQKEGGTRSKTPSEKKLPAPIADKVRTRSSFSRSEKSEHGHGNSAQQIVPKKAVSATSESAKSIQRKHRTIDPPAHEIFDTKFLRSVISAIDLRPTGDSIREQRSRLDLSQKEFAQLIGATSTSVKKWETQLGRLDLEEEILEALDEVSALTKRQVLKRLAKA